MDESVRKAVFRMVDDEPFRRKMGMKLIALENGYSEVEMVFDDGAMSNIYGRAHGGALFALIDEAFETAGQSGGEIVVALNVSVTYVASPEPGSRLTATARETARTRKTISFDIKVTDESGRILAVCQALGYKTGKPLPID